MARKMMRRKSVSPIVASLLIIAIAVAAGIIVYVYVNALAGSLTQFGGGQVAGPSVRIVAQIYDSSVYAGVLNEDANFTVYVSNGLASTQSVLINVEAGNSTVYGNTIDVKSGGSANVNFSQKLTTTGVWIVKATWGGLYLNSYSFTVYPNQDAAALGISQWKGIQNNTFLSEISIAVSVTAALISVASLWRGRKRY